MGHRKSVPLFKNLIKMSSRKPPGPLSPHVYGFSIFEPTQVRPVSNGITQNDNGITTSFLVYIAILFFIHLRENINVLLFSYTDFDTVACLVFTIN